MQLRFVGCSDAFGSGGGNNTCFHVTGARVDLLIDCGASSPPTLKHHGIANGASGDEPYSTVSFTSMWVTGPTPLPRVRSS
jgi:hypothetical protein